MFCPLLRAGRAACCQKKGVEFQDIDVMADTAKLDEISVRARRRFARPCLRSSSTEKHIGGSDDLAALDRPASSSPLLGPMRT